MNLNAGPPLVAAAAYLLVAFFVYSKNKVNSVNRSFAVMLLCISLWNVLWAGIIGGPNPDFVDTWGKIFRIPHLFIPPTILHFVILFTNPQGITRRSKKTLMFFYGVSCFCSAISWTRPFHGQVVAYSWGYSFKTGPLYVIYVLQFITSIIMVFFYMARGYTRANSYHRHRLKYFFLAALV